MAKVQDELMNHNYDGIQEYDNDLPGWWKNLFLITAIFALVYMVYYHVLGGPSSEEEYLMQMGTYVEESKGSSDFGVYKSPYASEMAELTPAARAEIARLLEQPFDEQLQMAMSKADVEQLAKLEKAFPDIYAEYQSGGAPAPESHTEEPVADQVDLSTLEPLTDEASLASGKQIWDTQCFACHKLDGGGSIGPNMTDEYWIHGGSYAEIIHLINVGVPAKGMIPWRGTLTDQQIQEVSSFILTLQGTNPPDAKAPEGEKVTS